MSDPRDIPRGPGGIPPVAVSLTSTLENPTGSWRYRRPAYQDGVAPCNVLCPVGVDIEGYMNLLRQGRVDEAADLLLRENPMPAVTGRVCDHPCETGCNRRFLDEGVSIHAVERSIGDLILSDGPPEAVAAARLERVAVVGSGPAGLACAYHLAREGYGVTIFEAAPEAGGMLRLGIPEYRLPRKVLDLQLAWLEAMGIEILTDAPVGSEVPWRDLEGFEAVFVAPGAHRERSMGMDAEDAPGVLAGLDFLKAVNAGEPPEVGRRVVVVGGGNTAMDCARTALRLGAEVTVVYRRTRKEMPAIEQEVEEAEREGVGFIFLANPRRATVREGRVAGVECVRMELGEPDESGRRRPVPTDEAPFSVTADTVITAIGEKPELSFLPRDLGTNGEVPVDSFGATGLPGLFGGGDAAGHERTVAHALGAGKRAAIGIDRYLKTLRGESVSPLSPAELRWGPKGNMSMSRWRGDDPVERTNPVNRVVARRQLTLDHFERVHRHEERTGSAPATGDFREVNPGLPWQVAQAEALRCLNCGVCNECELCMIFCPDEAIRPNPEGHGFVIDLEYCKGCGICAAECPRGAMVMTEEPT